MKKLLLMSLAFAVTAVFANVDSAEAQLFPRHRIGAGTMGVDGMTQAYPAWKQLRPHWRAILTATDHYSPSPIYNYSPAGVEAQLTHQWNQNQSASNPWHDNYSYWRFGTPTALVVPPTAGFVTNYGWGVGQTTSTPIHNQFGINGGGFGGGEGMFSQTPYWPSNTRQFGVHPVRGPWGH